MRRFLLLLGFILFYASIVCAVSPFGANVTFVNTSRATPDAPLSHNAIAGNVTEINIQGFSVTQVWQGYYGNVTGTIMLADSADNVFYNWSLASPQGEIYASRNNSINWNYVQCLNFTANGSYASDTANAGGTSLAGTNLTILENQYNISFDDVDGVNETFTLFGAGAHDLFYTANYEFLDSECRATRLFTNNGVGEVSKFEQVLLYEPTTQSVIFTSILDEDVLGFDGKTHDFQMLVLEDGHGTDTATTPYYFYVELE